MPAYRVVLLFEGVPDKVALNDLVWKMRQAGRDHAGVAMPTYERAWVAKVDSFGLPVAKEGVRDE